MNERSSKAWPVQLNPGFKSIDPATTQFQAGWSSFLTRDGERRDHHDLTDLDALAREIRARYPLT